MVTESIDMVDGRAMYRISNIDEMDPFLMTIVSNSDLWMFVSTTGALTAGRVEPADCLFPYETEDRLHATGRRVGPITILRIHHTDGTVLWEPFSTSGPGIRRSLLKSLLGDSVIFQEEHLEFGLVFDYRWAPSDRFGWVRTASLTNTGTAPRSVELVDGLRGVMPWGVGVDLQQRLSNLANAYRRSEVVEPGIGLFSLEAQIVDRPEPAEALRTSSVWTTGLVNPEMSLDPGAVSRARLGLPFEASRLRTGRPGSFLVNATVGLEPGQGHTWHIVGDVARSHADVAGLRHAIRAGTDIAVELAADIARSSTELRSMVGRADAFQTTGSATVDGHHLANTLFNVMRGGAFLHGYTVEAHRFGEFVGDRNRRVADRHAQWLTDLPKAITAQELRRKAGEQDDPNLVRLAHEYLPIGFSRRHGDPSRPWNHFAIRVRDRRGEPVLSYQGNWRDIFQNWEALSRSYPAYLPSMVAKFLNASTADGFNPYRLTSEGIDWEVLEPENPWSGIGYWGDHQIVYLYRLLRTLEMHDPGRLAGELGTVGFTFANVPYRIVPYDQLLRDPKASVDFDDATDATIAQRVAELGADGKLVTDEAGEIIHVTLLEKLLIPMLSKLSNYVPGGGIWMNTQRPEWNDANNALVGHGLSMVTLAHLRRYVELLAVHTEGSEVSYPISSEVAVWAEAVARALESSDPNPDDEERARIIHALGTAFDQYRSTVYQHGLSRPQMMESETVHRLCRAALEHLESAIRRARRADGLYHAYNLLRFSDDHTRAHVAHLPEMLEGQVAAISSGLLDMDEVVALLDAMYVSPLYREDVDSFLLYPARTRPSFVERNVIPPDLVQANPLLTALLESGSDTVLTRDITGVHHFYAGFRNAHDLDTALDRLSGGEFAALVAEHRASTLDVFEQVFHHHEFTGRSSTMYGYEGIGSVYWHMVAKLLVAIQESILESEGGSVDELKRLYERVRQGLGFNKSAVQYGAFPTDPYSHTPPHAGAQQPGMTGQVKEELLTRWAELGLTVANGSIRFTSVLLDDREFRGEAGELSYLDVNNDARSVDVEAGSAAFTICQVPVVVHGGRTDRRIVVTYADGTEHEVPGLTLNAATSRQIFDRDGHISRLDVFFPAVE
ncbi:MAG: hypothetical protein EX267_07000 [Acidimicrobiia bacterium]|nr:MAG: hypothetical protein EX267_07000 [Acidimicrobiia bacterium]